MDVTHRKKLKLINDKSIHTESKKYNDDSGRIRTCEGRAQEIASYLEILISRLNHSATLPCFLESQVSRATYGGRDKGIVFFFTNNEQFWNYSSSNFRLMELTQWRSLVGFLNPSS